MDSSIPTVSAQKTAPPKKRLHFSPHLYLERLLGLLFDELVLVVQLAPQFVHLETSSKIVVVFEVLLR
jgi:hypothetical protein